MDALTKVEKDVFGVVREWLEDSGRVMKQREDEKQKYG